MTDPDQLKRKPRRATMADVAERAGVSITTVSRMLSGLRPVSRSTTARIELAIAELRFRPNTTAQALRTRHSRDVSLLFDNVAHEANSLVARGAGQVLRAAGYNLLLYETDGISATLANVLNSLLDRGTDGAIILLPGTTKCDFTRLADIGMPLVSGGPTSAGWGEDEVVSIDEWAGIASVTSHVLAGRPSGHIAYVGGPAGDVNATIRQEAFLKTMNDARRPVDERLMLQSPWSHAGGKVAAERLVAEGKNITGVVCANDLIAIGVIQGLGEHGYAVPQDIAVTGFDNIEAAGLVNPGLTTVEPYELELGRVAAANLLARLSGEVPPRHQKVLPDLVIRESAP